MYQRRAFALGNFKRNDLVFEAAVFMRFESFLVAG
jgi:hypothetical protein